jgi:hypothetical protein
VAQPSRRGFDRFAVLRSRCTVRIDRADPVRNGSSDLRADRLFERNRAGALLALGFPGSRRSGTGLESLDGQHDGDRIRVETLAALVELALVGQAPAPSDLPVANALNTSEPRPGWRPGPPARTARRPRAPGAQGRNGWCCDNPELRIAS